MFRITLEPAGTTKLFVDDVVQIGSHSDLEIVLAGNDVLPVHAEIYELDGRVALAPRPGSDEPYLVSPTDRIAIGRHRLHVELVGDASADATGARLLAAITAASRPIYADWCEEQGAVVHAEYLRALDAPTTTRGPLRLLARQLPPRWRAQVACEPVRPRRAPPADAIVRRVASCCGEPSLQLDGRWIPASGSRVMQCRGCRASWLASALTATLDDHEPITEADADARLARTGFVWAVEPGRSIGPLELGMTEAELAAAWASIPRVCRLGDDMIDPDVTRQFDADGRCNRIAILINQPVPVVLDGVDLRVTDEAHLDPGVRLVEWERGDRFPTFVEVTAPTHWSRNPPHGGHR